MCKYNHSKVYRFVLVQVFVFLGNSFFPNIYHILKPYNTSWDEMVLNLHANLTPQSIILFQKFDITICLVYIYWISMNILLLKLEMWIFYFFSHIDILPYVCNIWIEDILQNVHCNAKNEPPYFAITNKEQIDVYFKDFSLCVHWNGLACSKPML